MSISISATTLRRLAALSLSAEAMAGVLEIIADMQDHDERRREAQRNRKRRSRDGHGTVTAQGRDIERDAAPLPDKEKCPKEINPSPQSSEAIASGAVAPPNERAKVFGWGLDTVCRITGRPPDPVRRLLGRWLKAMNDDCRALNRVIEDAVTANPAEPISWIEGVIRSRGTGPPRNGGGGGFASIALELRDTDDKRRFDQPEPVYHAASADQPGVVALPRYPAQRR